MKSQAGSVSLPSYVCHSSAVYTTIHQIRRLFAFDRSSCDRQIYCLMSGVSVKRACRLPLASRPRVFRYDLPRNPQITSIWPDYGQCPVYCKDRSAFLVIKKPPVVGKNNKRRKREKTKQRNTICIDLFSACAPSCHPAARVPVTITRSLA